MVFYTDDETGTGNAVAVYSISRTVAQRRYCLTNHITTAFHITLLQIWIYSTSAADFHGRSNLSRTKFTCSCTVLPIIQHLSSAITLSVQRKFRFFFFYFFFASSPAALWKFVHHIRKLFLKKSTGRKKVKNSLIILSYHRLCRALLSARVLLSCFPYTPKKITAIKSYSRRVFLARSGQLYYRGAAGLPPRPLCQIWIMIANFHILLKVYLNNNKKRRIGIISSLLHHSNAEKKKWTLCYSSVVPLSPREPVSLNKCILVTRYYRTVLDLCWINGPRPPPLPPTIGAMLQASVQR